MDSEAKDRPAGVLLRVWDLPTRLFHWLLVALLVASYVTAQLDELEWHMRSGECILALLLFRLAWGVVGSDTARFTRMVRGPRAVWRHFFGPPRPDEELPHDEPGHNPAGGWAVLVMLFVLCAQVTTGLFADDDISETGPFGQFVTRPTRKFLTGLHQRNFNILAALMALHVAAIAAYWLLRRKNLLWPMLTGVARLPVGIAAPRLRSLLLAGIIFAVSACVAAWVASFQDAAD
jgi:cytochrome b